MSTILSFLAAFNPAGAAHDAGVAPDLGRTNASSVSASHGRRCADALDPAVGREIEDHRVG